MDIHRSNFMYFSGSFFLVQRTNKCTVDNLLYCSYMFRHYCVIFRELVVSTCQITYVCRCSLGDTILNFKTKMTQLCRNMQEQSNKERYTRNKLSINYAFVDSSYKVIKDAKHKC